MNQRSVLIVRGHRPQRVPDELGPFEGMNVVAVVLSTHRSENADLLLDHELWFACMEAVSAVVSAGSSEVLVAPPRGFFRWFRRRKSRSAGALADYMARLRAGQEVAEWQTILWRKEDRVVAAATCEPWYRLGGPAPYHDSYTTSIFLSRAPAARFAAILQISVARAGGRIDGVLDAPNAA
jgi:hypothetical protein